MATPTLSARIGALESAIASLVALETARVAPAKTAPVTGTLEAPLYVSDKPRCAIHPAGACSRKLSDPAASHQACAGETDPWHARLRASHRHF